MVSKEKTVFRCGCHSPTTSDLEISSAGLRTCGGQYIGVRQKAKSNLEIFSTAHLPRQAAVSGRCHVEPVHDFRKTATTFSTSTTNRRLSPSKSTGMAPLGLNSTLSYRRSGMSGEFSISAETATIRPVMVGISMLSGSWMPPLVCHVFQCRPIISVKNQGRNTFTSRESLPSGRPSSPFAHHSLWEFRELVRVPGQRPQR